jgi:hypothetical protein
MNGIPLSVTYDLKIYIFYVISFLQEKITSVEILLEGRNYQLILGEDNLWSQQVTTGNMRIEQGLLNKLTHIIELKWLRKN